MSGEELAKREQEAWDQLVDAESGHAESKKLIAEHDRTQQEIRRHNRDNHFVDLIHGILKRKAS